MSTETDRREYVFQAEIKQLLHLLSHSLYQSREIALRELISNASDALDKMRYLVLTSGSEPEPLEITLIANEGEKTLVIRDNGVGMNRAELERNLGSIAHSGTGEFMRKLAESPGTSGVSLIGQFGVGFYSAFMIADRVQVQSRRHDESDGWEWESTGEGAYTIAAASEPLERGTRVILHLKADSLDLVKDWKIRDVVRRYSSFVPHPIRLGNGGEVLNSQKPIWVEPRNQVTAEEHTQFYQHLTHRVDETPLWYTHLAADSPIQFRAVLYCPKTNLELLGFTRQEHGLHLCARRILVQSDCRELLPEYLRFVEGLVDSEDLPLNVSRETLQDNGVIRKIRAALLKGVFDRLDRLAEDEPETFAKWHAEFGRAIKEGVITDLIHRERLAKLLRFGSSREEDPAALVSLDQYLGRMVEGQERIYYLAGGDASTLKRSPHLELFRKRGIEVLLLAEAIDSFAVSALETYQGKRLTAIDSSDLGLPGGSAIEPESAEMESGFSKVVNLFRDALGDRVADVRKSERLVENPCCLVSAEGAMTAHMERIMKLANQSFRESRRILELNPRSPLIKRLGQLSANAEHEGFIRDCALQLWSNALLLEGVTPEPEMLVARVSSFIEELADKRSPLIL